MALTHQCFSSHWNWKHFFQYWNL